MEIHGDFHFWSTDTVVLHFSFPILFSFVFSPFQCSFSKSRLVNLLVWIQLMLSSIWRQLLKASLYSIYLYGCLSIILCLFRDRIFVNVYNTHPRIFLQFNYSLFIVFITSFSPWTPNCPGRNVLRTNPLALSIQISATAQSKSTI